MTGRPTPTFNLPLVVLLFAGLIIRIGWVLFQPSDVNAINRLPDQREYLEAGQHLVNGEGLWFSDPRFEHAVYAYRTPGYPLLIRLCGAKIGIVRIVQSILDTSTILAVYLLAKRWTRESTSLIAAGIVAVNPYMIYFCGLILSETLFTAMLAWGMVLLILSDGPWPPTPGKKYLWLSGGLLLALAVLVRPGAVGLPVLLGVGAALANRPIVAAYRSHWPLPVMATLLLITALVLLPWAARNRLRVGSWIWTSTNAGITRYDGFNPDATGASDQRFAQWMPWLSDMTEVGRSRYFTEMADHWIADHWMDAVRLGVVKIGRTWSPVPLSGDYGSRILYRIVGLSVGIVVDALVLAGLWWGRLPRPAKRFLLLPALYFTISAALSVGSLRYLVPAEAPMAILAACAVEFLCSGKAADRAEDGFFVGQSRTTV